MDEGFRARGRIGSLCRLSARQRFKMENTIA
jgi:hypothetical protein